MGEQVTADRLRVLISYVPECRKHCAAPGPDPPSLIQFLLDGWPILWLSFFSYHREVDSDQSNDISFAEFCQMMHNLRSGALPPHNLEQPSLRVDPPLMTTFILPGHGEASLSKVVKKASHLLQVQGAGGAQHSFSMEEKVRHFTTIWIIHLGHK